MLLYYLVIKDLPLFVSDNCDPAASLPFILPPSHLKTNKVVSISIVHTAFDKHVTLC